MDGFVMKYISFHHKKASLNPKLYGMIVGPHISGLSQWDFGGCGNFPLGLPQFNGPPQVTKKTRKNTVFLRLRGVRFFCDEMILRAQFQTLKLYHTLNPSKGFIRDDLAMKFSTFFSDKGCSQHVTWKPIGCF